MMSLCRSPGRRGGPTKRGISIFPYNLLLRRSYLLFFCMLRPGTSIFIVGSRRPHLFAAAALFASPITLAAGKRTSMTATAALLVEDLRTKLQQEENPEKAVQMQRYLKTDQYMYGLPAPHRRGILKQALTEFPITTQAEYESAVSTLWKEATSRDEQYLAIDIAERFRTKEKYSLSFSAWPIYQHMTETATWWDLLDPIATHLVAPFFLTHRSDIEPIVLQWRSMQSGPQDGLWMRRASILVHLPHKDKTDLPFLQETLLHLMPEREFFIEKAIGWVLRDYARTDPEWVRQFVATHENQLAPLSKREALKHIGSSAPSGSTPTRNSKRKR